MSVGTDHDTPVFAVTSIETWWKRMGAQRYPNARQIFITADAGGSNNYRSRVWKAELLFAVGLLVGLGLAWFGTLRTRAKATSS